MDANASAAAILHPHPKSAPSQMIITGAKISRVTPGTYCKRIGNNAVIVAANTQIDDAMMDQLKVAHQTLRAGWAGETLSPRP